jgi:hypothetical protein
MVFSDTTSEIKHLFRCGIGKNHLVSMWGRNFPLRAFSDTRTEIISNRVIIIKEILITAIWNRILRSELPELMIIEVFIKNHQKIK